MGTQLYVSNLPLSATEEMLTTRFGKFGVVVSVALEAGEVAGDLGAPVEQQAHQVLRRVEAGDVAAIGERRRLPLDRLGDAVVGREDDVARAPHRRVERVVGLV